MKIKSTMIVTLFLALIMLCAPVVASAASTAEANSAEIKYSDLFYVYDTSYLLHNYFTQHSADVLSVTSNLLNDYVNSPKYKWTLIESVIDTLKAKEFVELVSDTYLDTEFNYWDAVDKANIKFAQNLLIEPDITKKVGIASKIFKRFENLLKCYNEFDKKIDLYQIDEIIIEEFFCMISDEEIFIEINSYQLTIIKGDLLPKLESLKNAVSGASEVFEVLKTVATGLMLEDLRLEILDDIIENADSSTTVQEGMRRLKKQLSNGLASYFCQTYLHDKAIEVLFKALQKVYADSISPYKFASTILEVASWVAFDVILNTPDIDDMMLQMILCEYVADLEYTIQKKIDSFKVQFTTQDIQELESLFTSYIAASEAALNASKLMTLSSNESSLQAVIDAYKDFSYENYIYNVEKSIADIELSNRQLKSFETWTITDNEKFAYPSDVLEQNTIYLCDSAFYCDKTIIEGTCTIAESTSVFISGDLEISSGKLLVSSNSSLTVQGDTVISGYAVWNTEETNISPNASLIVNGTMTISGKGRLRNSGYIETKRVNIVKGTVSNYDGGNIMVRGDIESGDASTTTTNAKIFNDGTIYANDFTTNKSGYYCQDESDAKLILTGNIDFYQQAKCKITAGIIVFAGTEQQTLKNITAYNIEVLNAKGIKYNSSISLYGNYDLNGNPLDCGNYSTWLYDGATLADGSNYQKLYINDTTFSLRSNIKCSKLNIYRGTLNILPNTNFRIEGNLYPGSKGIVNVPKGGTLVICGDVELGNTTIDEGKIKNSGIVYVNNLKTNKSGYYYQNEPDAKLILTGNIDFYQQAKCKITAGTIVFAGTEQQILDDVTAYNIEVLNPKGIKYNSSILVYGTFDLHGNTLDCGNYVTAFCENGAFGTLEYNQSDWIIDSEGTCGKPGSKHIECLICRETVKTAEIVIEHKLTQIIAQNPNCTEIGWEAYEKCSECEYTTYVEIPALEHNYNSTTVAPDYGKQGYTLHTCSHCGYSYKDNYTAELTFIHSDIDGNGTVEQTDVETLLKYITGWDVDVIEPALDVNSDGKVNIRDAAMILLYLSSKID